MKSPIMTIGLMLVVIIAGAQANETLPDELFRSEWGNGETRLLFMKSGEINDIGLKKLYKIESITKSNGYYTVIASNNGYYINMTLGTDNIQKSNALMISYDPNNLHNDLNAVLQTKNGKTGWLYREKPKP
jgi:hypothetical protein